MAKKIDGLYFQSNEKRKPGLLSRALIDEASMREFVAQYVEEDHSKLVMLCRHYGIQDGPAMFYQLSLALAQEIYPEPRPRGRKSKWTELIKGALVVEVERVVKPDDQSRGVAWACGVLANREPWKSFLEVKEGSSFGPDPSEALRKVYFDFRGDKWAAIIRDAFNYHKHEGTIAEWEARLFALVRQPDPK